MLRRSARARVVAKDEEKETTREGRPVAQPMLWTTSTARRWRSSKCVATSAKRRTLKERTNMSIKWLLAWSAGRIATEVCRMEISAKKTNKVFGLDKIDFEKHPRQ